MLKKKIFSIINVSLIIAVLGGCGGGTASFNGPQVGTRTVQLSLVAPSTYSDGSPIPPGAIAGYKIYYGLDSSTYTSNPIELAPNVISGSLGTVAVTMTVVLGQTYYIAATTYDAFGLESDYSNEMSMPII